MASPAAANSFEYTQLPDSGTHIRLIKIAPCVSQDDDIVCSVSTHNFADAPPYIAVSYTWGEPLPTKHIVVNGSELHVRSNCHYALWQARPHGKTLHIWLDAICIAQDDLKEKNHQVQMMGEIYKKADHVVVSLGLDDVGFEFLAARLAHAPQERSQEARAWYQRLNTPGDVDQASHLVRAMAALSEKNYWTRLWIIQELVLAQRIELLCGQHMIEWPKISNVLEYLPFPIVGSNRELFIYGYAIRRLAEYMRWTSEGEDVQDLETTLLRFGDNECSNPLDRIYGLLHMVDWPESVLGPLVVDYDKTPLKLAIDCLDRLMSDEDIDSDVRILSLVQTLMKAVKMSSSYPEMSVAIAHRRHQFHESYSRDDPSSQDTPSPHRTRFEAVPQGAPGNLVESATYITLSVPAKDCLQIRTSLSGSLTADVADKPDISKFFSEPNGARGIIGHEVRRKALSSIHPPATGISKPHALMQGSAVVGLLCPRARPGDYLLQLGYAPSCPENPLRVCLVIRYHTDQIFEIIGYGLISMDWLICAGGELCVCSGVQHKPANGQAFDVRFSKDDLVAFAALGLMSEELWTSTGSKAGVDNMVVISPPWLYTSVTSERFSSMVVCRSGCHENICSEGMYYSSWFWTGTE